MCRDELRFKRLKLLLQARELFSREALNDLRLAWRAVRKSAHVQGTYATELRLYTFTILIGLWALLPLSSLVALRVFSLVLPEPAWALGMLGVGLYGISQMLKTRGNVRANEDGRIAGLRLVVFAFVFVFMLQAATAPQFFGMVVFPYTAYEAVKVWLRLAKHGP